MFQSALTNAVRTFGRDDDCSSTSPPSKYTNISLSNLSAAFSNSPVVESLRRGGAQLYGLLQSRAGSDMSGQHPGQHASPFGYLFSPDAFTEPPELPHSSEPLLNLQENGFLSQFFQHQQTQQHSPTAFSTMGQIAADSRNAAPDYNWLMNEPPPTVQHVNAVPPTPGQQQHSHTISPHMALSDVPLSMDETILGAAALLSQPMQSQSHSSLHPIHTHHALAPPFHIERSHTQPVLSQHLFSSPGAPQALPSTTIEPLHTHDALLGISSSTVMEPLHASQNALLSTLIPRLDTSSTTLSTLPMSSAPQTAPATNRYDQIPNPRLYHFGSDNHFDANGFRPSSDFERHEYREELLAEELRRLKPINRTPDITREPSPTASQKKRPMSDIAGNQVDTKRSAHKRKRSDQTEYSSSEEPEASSKAGPATERAASKRQRRASAPGSSRSKRENLSDQQKRQNHIASEQKRRAQIKEGFDLLNQMVPELRDGGLSKSGMLMEACNFLEQLKTHNEKLCQRLGYPPRV